MQKNVKRIVLTLLLLVFTIVAFSAGGSAYRLFERGQRQRGLALYGSMLRIAGRSPISVPPSALGDQADLRPLDIFLNAERRLRVNYYEKIEDNSVLAFGTADSMVDFLGDPYSRFLEPDQLRAYAARQEGIYRGIGVVLAVRKEVESPTDPDLDKKPPSEEDRKALPTYEDPIDINSIARSPDGKAITRFNVFLVDVVPGSPAAEAGLRPGDVIHKVNGKLIFTRNLDSLDAMLLVLASGSVRVAVKRRGALKPIEVTVPFRETRADSVATRIVDGAGIIALRAISPGVAGAVRDKAGEMIDDRVNGIVLDLRRDGDGDADEACALASVFLSDGRVGSFKERGGKMVAVPVDTGRSLGKLPRLAILIDDTTVGPAEIVAAALKARGAARLFGSKTPGKASRQQLYGMSGNSALLLTTGLFFAPVDGPSSLLEGKGVAPDIVVNAREGAQDQVLDRALSWIKNGAA